MTWGGPTLENMPEKCKLMLKLNTSFGEKDTNFINEAGLYRLIFRSNKPKANSSQTGFMKKCCRRSASTVFTAPYPPKTTSPWLSRFPS
ncbi:BRO family protein [Methylobacter sp.]|uniref:BRO family protein n=1 Tax=Methylobacter sp. TaxID=2051955 RepID=UPI0035206971